MVDETMRNAMRHWTIVQPLVSSFVHSMVGDRTARDDLMQDIAIAVLESFERYDSSQPFAGWAVGIARNHVRLYFRTVHRTRLRFSDSMMEQLSIEFSELAPKELHRLEHLQTCLEQLDGRARELCKARYADDQKPNQMARHFGGTPNGIAKALQRIRQRLRECIDRQELLGGGTP
ncbi:MAG: sigma-70 family RNA polymerase sigma factor [Planctomycetes bacterium]|nr:sigma-70 family RNA polymerase sigma factor [Planctomycetota bacterium]